MCMKVTYKIGKEIWEKLSERIYHKEIEGENLHK